MTKSEIDEARKCLGWVSDDPQLCNAIERLFRALLAEDRQASPREQMAAFLNPDEMPPVVGMETSGQKIIDGLGEALAHARGELPEARETTFTVAGMETTKPPSILEGATFINDYASLRDAAQVAADALTRVRDAYGSGLGWELAKPIDAALARLAEVGVKPGGAG